MPWLPLPNVQEERADCMQARFLRTTILTAVHLLKLRNLPTQQFYFGDIAFLDRSNLGRHFHRGQILSQTIRIPNRIPVGMPPPF